VIGIGNRRRSDDAAGLEVVARLRGALPEEIELLEPEGEPTSLIDAWRGADAAWVVDAVSSGAPAGTIEAARLELGETLTPDVAEAVGRAADAVRGEILAWAVAR
jgi:hydrogenase maturation protease